MKGMCKGGRLVLRKGFVDGGSEDVRLWVGRLFGGSVDRREI